MGDHRYDDQLEIAISDGHLAAQTLDQLTQIDLHRLDPQRQLFHGVLSFRAVCLVIDVGLHGKGWSRAQAIEFIIENTGGSESGATLEVDRYIALPAQALGYKIDQLKISAIRAKAEQTLGAHFDIRAFHESCSKTAPCR